MTVDLHMYDPPDGIVTCDIRMACVDCGKVNPGHLHCCCYQFFKKSLAQQMAEKQMMERQSKNKTSEPRPNPTTEMPRQPSYQHNPFNNSHVFGPEYNNGFQPFPGTLQPPFKYIPPTPEGWASIPENSPGFQEYLRTHVDVEPTPFPTIYPNPPK